MQITLFHSQHDPASCAVREALESQPGITLTLVDVYDPANAAQVEAAAVAAAPRVVITRDDATALAILEGAQCGPLAFDAFDPAAAVVDVPFVVAAVGMPLRVVARHPDVAHAGAVALTINGEAATAQTLGLTVDNTDPENPVLTPTTTPSAYVAGEAPLDLVFAEPGEHLVAVGGLGVYVQVVPAPEPPVPPAP